MDRSSGIPPGSLQEVAERTQFFNTLVLGLRSTSSISTLITRGQWGPRAPVPPSQIRPGWACTTVLSSCLLAACGG
eukprot:scaffold265593_cov31-Tisochrysis_lutea.AAC.4